MLDQDQLEGSLGRPGIVLFDELEKASPEVLQALLNVFDNGVLTVASGERTYSFRNALVFMTSNLGARDIQRYEQRQRNGFRRLFPTSARGRHRKIEDIIRDKLLRTFSPEFVNRIDNITIFNWIEPALVERLVELEIERLNRRLLKHRCRLEARPEVLTHIARAGFDRQFGALLAASRRSSSPGGALRGVSPQSPPPRRAYGRADPLRRRASQPGHPLPGAVSPPAAPGIRAPGRAP
ncbi:MAG: AAA family ATPase [Arhodomonas sp.]|nr:AAA family ATPase [Arhodomonas sp.]